MTVQPVKSSKAFGCGFFYGFNNINTPTPTTFDTLQDWEIQFKRDTKSLFGEEQFAADVCAGPATVTGKVTGGSLTGRMFGDLIVGSGNTNLKYNAAKFEQGIVNSQSGPHTIRVKNHSAGVFIRDCGVRDQETNLPLIRVATITKKNHYTVTSGGVYTFHESRDGDTLQISYMWSGNPTGYGSTIFINNQPQGKIGNFTAVGGVEWNGEQNVVTLNSCMATDASLGTKQGDYYKPPFSFMAECNSRGQLGSLSFAQER